MTIRWSLVIVALFVLGTEIRGRGLEDLADVYGTFNHDQLLVRVVRQSILEGRNDENTISVFQVGKLYNERKSSLKSVVNYKFLTSSSSLK